MKFLNKSTKIKKREKRFCEFEPETHKKDEFVTINLPPVGPRPKRREPSEAAALLTPARQAPRWSGELASVTPPVSALHVYCQAPRWGGSARARCRRSLRRGPTATSAAGRGGPQTRGGAGPRVPRFRRDRGFPRTPQGAWM